VARGSKLSQNRVVTDNIGMGKTRANSG